MKIVIVTPFYPPEIGILGTYAKGLEEAFKKRGDEAVVVSMGSLKSAPTGLRHLRYLFQVLRAARGASCILAIDTWTVAVPAALAARIIGVPFLIRIGGDPLWERFVERTGESVLLSEFYDAPRALSRTERIMARLIRMYLRTAHAVMFNTAFQKDIWMRAYRIPNEKASVLENYFPQKALSPTPEGKVFVLAARASAIKNTERFERAFARVKERHPDIELDTRALPHEEQLRRLARCYALAVPSISEVGSNSAIEAVSFGRPFIMTNDTGTKERLAACGLFVDTRGEEELERGIESLLDEATYRRLCDGIERFTFVHSWDDIATEITQKL